MNLSVRALTDWIFNNHSRGCCYQLIVHVSLFGVANFFVANLTFSLYIIGFNGTMDISS